MIATNSNEINALLNFYKGRKLIAVQDIIEFSEVYQILQAAALSEKVEMALEAAEKVREEK